MIVVWRVTERCNLACPFCAYDRRLTRPRREAATDAVMAFGAALATHQRATGDPVLVSWLGGEPLLWRPLAALTMHFVRDLGLAVSATTNGTALSSPSVRMHLVEHYAELTVSIDGFAPQHDALRGRTGGYDAVRQGVMMLVDERRRAGRGPRLRVNVVLMRRNVRDFERLCIELAAWGVDEITFNQLGGNDRPEFFPANRLRAEDLDGFDVRIDALRRQLAANGVRLSGGARYLERIRASADGRRLPVADCAPGRQFLFVNERGRVAPCSFTEDAYSVTIADVASALDVAALPARFEALRSARRAAVCDDCPSTQVFAKFDRPDAHADAA